MTVRRLNILLSYPVKWSLREIFRDYIQNFYDSLGPEKFHAGFHHQYDADDDRLFMRANVSFDMEWLCFLGASTKQKHGNLTAGKFGEGFKIASLTAYRDFHLTIQMESQNWQITVGETDGIIDGQPVKYLAYYVDERIDDGASALALRGIMADSYALFRETIFDFFYPENTRFGKQIAAGSDYAVYLSPEKNERAKQRGYIYAAYQMRKIINLPVVICSHRYAAEGDDRDREFLHTHESVQCILGVVRRLSPAESSQVLEALRAFWSGVSSGAYAIPSKDILEALLYTISTSPEESRRFAARNGSSIIAGISPSVSKNRKKMAIAWYRHSDDYGQRRVVLSSFQRLGIESIEQLCERHNGFQVYDSPTREECEYIAVLKAAAEALFSDLICYARIPDCKIIRNPEAPVAGLAHTMKETVVRKNAYGMTTRYQVQNIFLKERLLCADSFAEALTTYLHELLHQFGTDNSELFHQALFHMNKYLLEKGKGLQTYYAQWRQVHLKFRDFENQSGE